MEQQAHGNKEDKEYLHTIFHLFDKDGDRRITADELMTVLESLKLQLSKKELKEQVDKVMADGDKDHNGTIDYDEFLEFMESRMAHQGKLKEMKDAFCMFDCDSNGFIEAAELKSVMFKLGNDLSDKEVEAMIKDADLDGNGKIDFDEFVKYMMEK